MEETKVAWLCVIQRKHWTRLRFVLLFENQLAFCLFIALFPALYPCFPYFYQFFWPKYNKNDCMQIAIFDSSMWHFGLLSAAILLLTYFFKMAQGFNWYFYLVLLKLLLRAEHQTKLTSKLILNNGFHNNNLEISWVGFYRYIYFYS